MTYLETIEKNTKNLDVHALAEAAEILLRDPAVMSFFHVKSNELYQEFVNGAETGKDYENIRFHQHILSELIGYLKELVARRDNHERRKGLMSNG